MDEQSIYELMVWQEAVRNLPPEEKARYDEIVKRLIQDTLGAEAIRQIQEGFKKQMTTAVVYGKPKCTYCDQAKNLLTMLGIQYEYKDVIANPEFLVELKEQLPAVRTVPQIWVASNYVGGFDDLVALLKKADEQDEINPIAWTEDADFGQGPL